MKSLLFVTGTRADFGKLKPLISICDNVKIFATGMHMLDKYGMTCNEITKSGFRYFPFINQDKDTPMDQVLSNTIEGLSYYLRENKTDLLVVHGDRVETLAGACVGALNNVLVAHIEGGEISGTIDESIRHAVTKLSHVHFVANKEAEKRLRQMGEDNIFVIGSPDIDVMLSDTLPSLQQVKVKYDIEFSEYAICIYHPVTTEQVDLGLFDVLEESGLRYIVIYPNNDTGSKRIIKRIDKLGERFHVLPSMRFEYFLTLLKNSRFIIGNSSAGIREAPVYGVPTIDVGSRQEGRSYVPSIVNCRTLDEIRHAIKHLPKAVKSFEFGKGDSAHKFKEALPEVWKISPQKRFVDR
ncbi:MAG: UDP-N-acetylglucosamine 2-epimerase (hydrolyzing), partial [Proteobacteria bacterium]|nr:UDP-N-acetylglucosamine 2-epimerase (hydrolyzing) [Pseudomonadota bacterium]